MGAKTGYANVILCCLGLRPGQGADRYVWCEPDAGVRLLLHAMTSREIATKAAGIIASWKDEDPKALWLKLRAEGPAVCPPIDPREVARWVQRAVWSYEQGNIRTGFVGPGQRRQDTTATATATARIALDLPATITADARDIDPREVAPGVVVFIDPPYENCSGYAHVFPRSEWLPIVRRWAEAGALVCVSEAEPIPDLMAEGWHAVEITGERVGQKRTFSKQQREWLTMSRPPAWKPSIQGKLFA